MMNVNETSFIREQNVVEELGLSYTTYVFILVLNLLIVLIGLLGNISVLYSSVKYKAIKVDRISRALLEALTISDIAILVLYFTPMLITLCGKRWILGSVVCFLSGLISEVPFYFQVMVKTIISCYRLWVCKSKRSVQGLWVGKTYIVKLCIMALLIPALAPAIVFMTHQSTFNFVPKILRCLSNHHSRTGGVTEAYKQLSILTIAFIAIPTVIILTTNASIWIIVQKSHLRSTGRQSSTMSQGTSKRMRKTALMLTLICCTFVLCYIPTFVKFLLYNLGNDTSIFLYLFHSYALSLNSIVNPFIYITTNQHFRTFVKNCFQNMVHENNSSVEVIHLS